jgi:hypothetical protein
MVGVAVGEAGVGAIRVFENRDIRALVQSLAPLRGNPTEEDK